MITKKFKIKYFSKSFDQYIYQSTGIFYKLYNNPELMYDKGFILSLLGEYNLIDVSIYESIRSDVLTKLSQRETDIKNKKSELKRIKKELEEDDFKNPKRKYHLINKYKRIERNINKNVCFGGKILLRNITKLKQKLQQQKLTPDDEKYTNDLINKYHKEYVNKRELGVYKIGNSIEGGNRKFDFDLINKKITFKPNKNFKTEIIFLAKKNHGKELYKLQKMIDNNQISVTVRLNKNDVCLCYDEKLLNGFQFNKTEYFKEIKGTEDKEQKKEIFIKYKNEQQNRQLNNKKLNRYMSVDLNPYEIGVTICDKNVAGLVDKIDEKEIVFKHVYVLKDLNKKLGLSSQDKKQIKENNKRKFELKQVWKTIFDVALHYKVSYFCIEDLNMKPKDNEKGKEFNKMVNNLWHRTLTVQLINKYCNVNGIILLDIEPYYSSFIGNMVYKNYDCISASLELCRRGMNKYIKGYSLYPSLESINQEKLNYLLGENVFSDGSWVNLYKVVSNSNSGLRYRNKSITDLEVKNLQSYKSKIKIMF